MKTNSIFPLLKVQFLSFFGINKLIYGKKKGKAAKAAVGITLAALLGVLVVALLCFYIYLYATLLGETGLIGYFMPLLLFVVSAVVLVAATVSASGSLFGFKDYEMVMSLPVKTSHIVLAKLLYIYITNVGFSLLVFVAALVFSSPYMAVTAVYVINTLLIAVFAPFLPISVAVFLGTVFSFVTSRMRHKNIVQTVLYLVFFAVMFLLPQLMPAEGDDVNITLGVFEAVAAFISHIFVFTPYSLAYIGASLFIFALPCLFLAKNFKKINTLLLTHRSRGKYKVKEVQLRGKLSALLVKEIKRLFSSAIYAINTLICPLFAIVLCVYAAVSFSPIVDNFAEYGRLIAIMAMVVFGVMLSVSPTTACSVSLEGKNLWIVKSSPVTTQQILSAKLLLNIIFTVPVMSAVSVTAAVILKVGAVFGVFYVICACAMPVVSSIAGLLLNLALPVLNWETETVAIKRSGSVAITMFAVLGATVVLGILGYFLGALNPIIALAAIAVIVAFLIVGGLLILYGYGVNKFDALE